MKKFLVVLALSGFCFAQGPQQPTAAQIKSFVQQAKDDNVQLAAKNNAIYSDYLRLLDMYEQVQKQIAELQEKLNKKEDKK